MEKIDEQELNWEKKYLKYKSKYLSLKSTYIDEKTKTNNINQMVGAGCERNIDNNHIFLAMIKSNLESGNWDKKTLLLDCVHDTKMQTETVKMIDCMISTKQIKLNKKQLDIALMYAVFCGYYIIVEKLISLGANPLIRHEGNTLVDVAINLFFHKTAEILIKYGGVSKNFYLTKQFPTSEYNFTNEPENLVLPKDNQIKESIYKELKEKMSLTNKYSFDNLSRNIFKIGLKGKVELK